ncbi:MAG: type 2 isopentenyl-diphosphate Delta-isomerase [Silvanigrellaceae bacterium]
MEKTGRPATLEDTPERAAARKQSHIDICANAQVESVVQRPGGWFLAPEALPDFSPQEIETSQSFLGRKFSLPVLVTGMTGGVREGQRINEILACAAERWNIPMGLGSQKLMLKDPSCKKLFDVRAAAPGVFLIGNLGAVSFNYGIRVEDVVRMVDELQLNAFALHVNSLQEQVQPEGERNFGGLLEHVENLVRALPVPVMVKEVGSGMTASTCRRILATGVKAVDVGGHGGTSWGVIEGMRGNSMETRLGELFRNWGLSTEESIIECHPVASAFGLAPARQLVATGGVRDGLQVAILTALGAAMCGVGLPFFRSVVNPPSGMTSDESLDEEIGFFARSLEIAMYCSGSRTLQCLPARLRKRS